MLLNGCQQTDMVLGPLELSESSSLKPREPLQLQCCSNRNLVPEEIVFNLPEISTVYFYQQIISRGAPYHN